VRGKLWRRERIHCPSLEQAGNDAMISAVKDVISN
jgi:hypothetical protein